jgi:hypothetical protein
VGRGEGSGEEGEAVRRIERAPHPESQWHPKAKCAFCGEPVPEGCAEVWIQDFEGKRVSASSFFCEEHATGEERPGS